MRLNKISWALGLILLYLNIAAAQVVYHDEPAPVVQGERLHLEMKKYNMRDIVTAATLFFRLEGEQNFRSLRLREEGPALSVDLPTTNLRAGTLEYYFAYQDGAGKVHYLPENNPEMNPYRVKIIPPSNNSTDLKNGMDILLLSPEPNAILPPDELMISFSIPLEVENPGDYNYKMFISGVDVTRLLQRDDHVLFFTPPTIRSGLHNVELKVFDKTGRLVGQKSFSFRITGKPSTMKGFNSRTTFFVDNRYQNIAQNAKNYYRAGLNYTASYKKFDFDGRALLSSEESSDRQPVNKFLLRVRYNFNSVYNLYLQGGDFSNNIDVLSQWGRRIRGVNAGMRTRFFNLDVSYGQSRRAVEGAVDSAGTIVSYGTYKQTFLGIHPQFNFGSHVSWGLDLVNSKDEPGSIQYGTNPKEALVLGTTVKLNFDGKRILLSSSVQASIKNEDATGKIDFDSLADRYELSGSERDLAQKFVNIMESTGFLTLTQGLSPIPSMAWRVEAQLRYFNQILRAEYKKIDTEFAAPGNPYLLKDISGLFVNDNIRLLSNQVFLNLYFKLYQDNLADDQVKTDNTEFGGAISYYPFSDLPSVSLSYGTYSRINQLAREEVSPDTTALPIEDNQTQRIGLSSSYNFRIGGVRNVFSLSVNKFIRNDDIYARNQSESTLLTAGVRHRFAFPLSIRWSLSQSESKFGGGSTEFTTNIKKLNFGLDYLLSRVVFNGDLKPFVSFSLQKIDNTGMNTSKYDRTNVTAGLNLIGSQIGNFTLRYDYIDFGNLYQWKDSILSARYDLSF